MNKTEGGVRFWGKEREFSLEHVKIEVSVGHPEVNTLFYLVCVGGINLGTDIITISCYQKRQAG